MVYCFQDQKYFILGILESSNYMYIFFNSVWYVQLDWMPNMVKLSILTLTKTAKYYNWTNGLLRYVVSFERCIEWYYDKRIFLTFSYDYFHWPISLHVSQPARNGVALFWHTSLHVSGRFSSGTFAFSSLISFLTGAIQLNYNVHTSFKRIESWDSWPETEREKYELF